MRPLHIGWAIFGCLLVVAAWIYHLSGPDLAEVGGRCACIGFLFLAVLLFGMLLDEIVARRRARRIHKPRGFDVIPGKKEEVQDAEDESRGP